MRAAALLAAALLGPPVQETPPSRGDEPAPNLATPKPIAGMRGFMSLSRLTFHDAPDRPHELAATYVFPDRAVWRLGLVSRPGERTMSYRAGDACWHIGPASYESERLTGDTRDAQVFRMELRRALTIWPDGFEWAGDGDTRATEIGALGRFVAQLGEDGLPRRVTAFDTDGAELESLDEIRWVEQHDRHVPRSFELSYRGQPVWSEEVASVSTDVNFLDYRFWPPDRRPEIDGELRHLGRPMHIDLRAAMVRRTPLEPGTGWKDALARARTLRAEAQAELEPGGRSIEGGANFELTEDAKPASVVLVLDGPVLEEAPPGWSLRAENPAVTVYLQGDAAAIPRALRALRDEVPNGARGGVLFARADPAKGIAGKVQLVLPLIP